MLGRILDRVVAFVTQHNRLVILILLVLTAGVGLGAGDLNTDPEQDNDAFGDTEVAQKQAYLAEHYRPDVERNISESELRRMARTETKTVYVRDPDGNVLSKSALLRTLQFQQRLQQQPLVGDALERGESRGVATLVGQRAAQNSNATVGEQVTALDGLSEEDVERLVGEILSQEMVTQQYMPNDYEPGSTRATSRKMELELRAGQNASVGQAHGTLREASRQVFEHARAVEHPEYFTLDQFAFDKASTKQTNNTFQLIVPFALALILLVLAFVYRDLVDILVGFTGVLVSVLWMFGILGWLQVPANAAIIVGPVLIVGLSVDYGLHVFMRYREQRTGDGNSDIRGSMYRSLRSVAVALALVTTTTAVGFAANITNEFSAIRGLAIGISVGVLGSFVIFVTLVPALKISIDGLLERIGLSRTKQPLGEGRFLRPVLLGGVSLARRGAPVVVVVALLVAILGGTAWTGLERKGLQEDQDDVAEWKTQLPDPIGWAEPDAYRHSEFVDETYRSSAWTEYDRSQILVQGPVTDSNTLEQMHAAAERLRESETFYRSDSQQSVISPLAALTLLSERNEQVAAVVRETDTDDNGVPDTDLTRVYDTLYDVAPDRMARVIERTDDGYASLRMVVLLEESATLDQQATTMQTAADTIEQDSDLTATAVGRGTIIEAESIQTAQSILETLVLALLAVFVILMVVYRLAEGSASLGAVTAFPIAMITAYLIGSMWVLDIPLTVVTALLMSLVVGLGIDYSIHISDRFAQELDAGVAPFQALERAVTGTGGALLGSTLTSAAAFTAILLHPSPRIRSFGTLVILALTLSFVVSVYVLPSILLLWYRHVRGRSTTVRSRLPDWITSD
jgi:predicted RND superfamily exporter protein